MQVNYFGALAAAVFVLQFALCLKKVKLLFRLLPTALLLAGAAFFGILYVFSNGFGSAIVVIVLAALLALDGIAWLAAFLVTHIK